MPPKAATAMKRNMHRENVLQIREQQAAIQRMKQQENEAREKTEKRATRMKAQWGGAGAPQAADRQQQHQQHQQQPQQQQSQAGGERIEVFVRETEPALAKHYVIHEGTSSTAPAEAACQRDRGPAPCQAPAAAMAAACGSAAGTAGAARRNSANSANKPGVRPAGYIPPYLKQRKQELQEEKDQCAQQVEEERLKKQYPAGHVPLSQMEKEAILAGLEQRKLELMSDINRLPMRFDTQAIQKRRNGLEEEIRDIESRINTFSRKQVFVPA
ncbi:flagellar/basal body protein [Diplonema papillatum]|nr:flagellar/basal body protein [Diplonema papillatum]